MPDEQLTLNIPTASPNETTDEKVAKMERWLAGHVDKEGKHHPGLVAMVGEMYDEAKARKERREAMLRGLTIGSSISLLGFVWAWLRDHIK